MFYIRLLWWFRSPPLLRPFTKREIFCRKSYALKYFVELRPETNLIHFVRQSYYFLLRYVQPTAHCSVVLVHGPLCVRRARSLSMRTISLSRWHHPFYGCVRNGTNAPSAITITIVACAIQCRRNIYSFTLAPRQKGNANGERGINLMMGTAEKYKKSGYAMYGRQKVTPLNVLIPFYMIK